MPVVLVMRMKRSIPLRLWFLLICAIGAVSAQQLSLPILRDALARMVLLNVDDAQVAARLRRMQPRERVPESLRQEAEEWGAGPLTLREVDSLIRESDSKPPSRQVFLSPPGRRGQFEIVDGEPAVILESIRLYAEDYSESIPNFLCFRNTSFFQSRNGIDRWKQNLHFRERLVHLEDGDHHQIVEVDGEKVDEDTIVLHGGITVSGEFGNILRRIFESKTQTRFYWIGEEQSLGEGPSGGERLVAIAFSVEKEHSSMELSYGGKKEKEGYRGDLIASGETGQIVRIRLAMNPLPKGFPIRGAAWDIRYAPVKVDEQELLLPVSATTEAYQRGVFLKNEATYTDYQKYSAESSISFGGTAELDNDK